MTDKKLLKMMKEAAVICIVLGAAVTAIGFGVVFIWSIV